MDHLGAHQQHADSVRAAATTRPGATGASLRTAVLARAGGGPPIAEPYDALARQIGEAAHRVTDAQVDGVRTLTGSDKGAFEIIMAACIGAGLTRWNAAVQAIEEAGNAAS